MRLETKLFSLKDPDSKLLHLDPDLGPPLFHTKMAICCETIFGNEKILLNHTKILLKSIRLKFYTHFVIKKQTFELLSPYEA